MQGSYFNIKMEKIKDKKMIKPLNLVIFILIVPLGMVLYSAFIEHKFDNFSLFAIEYFERVILLSIIVLIFWVIPNAIINSKKDEKDKLRWIIFSESLALIISAVFFIVLKLVVNSNFNIVQMVFLLFGLALTSIIMMIIFALRFKK